MVDLEVALTVLVTERPKKLKPLRMLVKELEDKSNVNLPNTDHDQNT